MLMASRQERWGRVHQHMFSRTRHDHELATEDNDYRDSAEDLSSLVERVDFLRLDAARRLDPARRAKLGQFFTPPPVARLMASMFQTRASSLRLLDAGAGVGTLSAAWVAEMCSRSERPQEISVIAYELDSTLVDYLEETLHLCRRACERIGVRFRGEARRGDFIRAGVDMLRGGLFAEPREEFDCAILNPPYHKINTDSEPRRLLRAIGLEVSNLYPGFLFIALRLLKPGGQLVAITPRSFCNGPYFKGFRSSFLREAALRRLHVFESREHAFQDDEVLQENVILHAVRHGQRSQPVLISSSVTPEDDLVTVREVDYARVVRPDDPNCFIRLLPDELGQRVAERMAQFRASLSDLDLEVSTGRVVDFRADKFLRDEPAPQTVPLIYPAHFANGYVKWPRKDRRKPNAILRTPKTEDLLVPPGTYVLVKRFSSKEERRRVVAAIYDWTHVSTLPVGFENHLNYYHRRGKGLPPVLAKGLAAFLNSTLVDSFFRQFSGHTQVNATDLRSLRYPSLSQLESLGARVGDDLPRQDELDEIIENELLEAIEMLSPDPVRAKKRIDEARSVLRDLDFPRQQQNERSALTLLSLLDLTPTKAWSEAGSPLRGITQMMKFFEQHYGKVYAPNTRETVRRQTVHQFLEAGIIVANPDDPTRPTNSGKNVYQIEERVLELLRTFGTEEWNRNLQDYLTSAGTLSRRYAQEREMHRIPVTLPSGSTLALSPGGQNVLIKEIINEFGSRFTPKGEVLYVGDADEKFAVFDERRLNELGVTVEEHGKMPDVIIYHREKGWLVLIEAVTSHGPVNPKRRNELVALFSGAKPALVFVTAFLDRRTMARYLNDISWETEVWVADHPSHLIHFNGERLLGPREERAAVGELGLPASRSARS